MIMAKDLTPVELRNGRWYKREDLFRLDNGVNGSKLRACFHLVSKAKAEHNIMEVISASSVLSPQAAMGATVAKALGLGSVTLVGGTTPEKAVKHTSVRMAHEQGSLVFAISVGYNPALQSAGRKFVQDNPGSWQLPYGITTPADATLEDQREFVAVGAPQVANIPDGVETIVLPFGSGNTAAGVLFGLSNVKIPASLKQVVLMTIGPDRRTWLEERLDSLDSPLKDLGVKVNQTYLHPNFSTYSDRMPETLDGIVLHPTYEGKVARYLNLVSPEWWTARDEKTLMWIVGAPL